MRESNIKDKNERIVKEGNTVRFSFKGTSADGKIVYRDHQFIMETPENNPLSCMLGALNEMAGDFEIVDTIQE